MAVVGDRGHAIIPRLRSKPNELVLDKNTGSAFNSTGIDFHLRNMGVTTLAVTGIATDMCVMVTSLDAADRGWNVFIVSDACTTVDNGSHEAALLNFRRVFGKTPQTREIVELLGRGLTARHSSTPRKTRNCNFTRRNHLLGAPR